MPRGVYDRSKMKKTAPAPNGSRALAPTIEDVETLVPEPALLYRDGERPWGRPYEADAHEFEKRNSPWEELYDDAMLRLERTPASKAIVYPFEDDREADRAYESVQRRARARLGKGFIQCGVRRDPPPRVRSARPELV